jgi:hypothetical protein
MILHVHYTNHNMIVMLSRALTTSLFLLSQDCFLILRSPFYLEVKGGLLEFIETDNGHIVIVVAEDAGEDLTPKA